MFPLWMRSLRTRPVIAVLLFALSSTAVMTSALGPLFVRAVHQSSLADAVATAGPAGSSVAASLDLERGDDLSQAARGVLQVFDGVAAGPAGDVWQSPQLSVQTTSNLGWRTRGGGPAEIVSRVVSGEGGCAQLLVVSGRCPTREGETLVSVADVQLGGARLGSSVSYTLPSIRTTTLRVVGIYDPDRSATLDLLRPASIAGQLAQVTGEPLVTTRDQLDALDLGANVSGRLLLAETLTAQNEPAARQTLDRVKAATVAVADRLVVFDSQLPQLLDEVDRRVASAAVLILVTIVQAEALALFALVIALQRLGQSRSAEWGVGRLRGMPWRHWLSSIWAEPAFALVLGLPIGLLAAVGVGTAVIHQSLRSHTPVEWLRWPVLTAAAAAVLVALLTLVAVSVRDVRRPLIELLQQAAESRRANLLSVVAQTAVVLLAVAALYQLLSGGVLNSRGSQLGLLTPALLAFAIAVIAVRVMVVAVRRITARPPRTLTGLVVGRHAARMPSALNPAIVVAAGLALAVFSTQVLALSVRNQGLRAQAIVGADTVLHVRTPATLDLVEAVRAADPSGRAAMAVKEKAQSSDGGTSRIVAIDSTRVDAVAPWLASWVETQSLAQALHPAAAAPVVLEGSRVALTTTGGTLKTSVSDNYSVKPAPPDVSLIVQAGGGPWQTVPLGPLQAETSRYSAPLPCPTGCRLVGIDLYSGKGQTYKTAFTITALETDHTQASTLSPRLRDPSGWREAIGGFTGPGRSQSITPAPAASGLEVRAADFDGDNHNTIAPTDFDDPLPAVLAPGLDVEPFPGLTAVAAGTGLDGQSQLIKVVSRAAILPRALNDGVLVDLPNAEALSNPADSDATSEVWLTRDAPASVEEQLTSQGITVLSREHLDDTRAELLGEGNTRGAVVAVWVAMAGLLITLLTLAGARAADADRRRRDWAALNDAGVRPKVTRSLAFLEIAAPAVLGALVGVASGIAAIKLGASRLPLVDVYAPGPPLDLRLTVSSLAWLGGGGVVVILATATFGALAETRRRTDS